MSPQDFINTVAPGAQVAMNQYRVLASLSIAQAALESGWGEHTYTANNLFGIKANGWKGRTVTIRTAEEDSRGNRYYIRAAFRAYDNWGQSIADHAAFLAQNSRYHNILGLSDYKSVCRLIKADGYATEHDYAVQLISLIEQHRLYQYDTHPALTTIDSVVCNPETGDVTVTGWGLNAAGLREADVYFDGAHGLTSTRAFFDRPDVKTALNPHGWYPDGARCGFSITIPAGKIPVGQHRIGVAAIGRDGSASWAYKDAKITAPVPAPVVWIDCPTQGEQIGADVKVSGWGIAGEGVDRVDIYADGKRGLASVKALSPREDVNKAMNKHGWFKDALHSGFAVTIPASILGKGKHTIDVAVVSRDNKAAWASIVINVL